MFLVKSVFRKRFANLSSAISNRLWLNADTNHKCDVLLTFPERIEDHVITWFLEKFIELQPDIRISIKYHFTTGNDGLLSVKYCGCVFHFVLFLGVYGFYLTFTYER